MVSSKEGRQGGAYLVTTACSLLVSDDPCRPTLPALRSVEPCERPPRAQVSGWAGGRVGGWVGGDHSAQRPSHSPAIGGHRNQAQSQHTVQSQHVCSHGTVTAQSQRNPRSTHRAHPPSSGTAVTVTARSQHSHGTVTAQSPHSHSIATAQSQHSHSSPLYSPALGGQQRDHLDPGDLEDLGPGGKLAD